MDGYDISEELSSKYLIFQFVSPYEGWSPVFWSNEREEVLTEFARLKERGSNDIMFVENQSI